MTDDPDRDKRMPWGKHRGELIENVPTEYLIWLLGNTDVDETHPHLAKLAQEQLDLRDGKGVHR